MTIIDLISKLFQSGLVSLASYLAAHVLLCLLPAFFIAGALTALFPKEAVTRFLGKDTQKWISYPAATISGFVLAVCSCTIMPLFTSIDKKGAGLGPAITFLFVGPAVNILAISFTGVQIGMDIAAARLVLALVFGIVIGLLMAWFFRKDDEQHNLIANNQKTSQQKKAIPASIMAFFILLLATLIIGTLQISPLSSVYRSFDLLNADAYQLQRRLNTTIPADPKLGIEGISVHGFILIFCLSILTLFSIKGFRNLEEGLHAWTKLALGMIAATLLFAALRIDVKGASVTIGLTGRLIAEIVVLTAIWYMITHQGVAGSTPFSHP